MCCKKSSLSAGAAFILIFSLQSGEFDRGGITFPMEKISAERFSKTDGKEVNLLKNGDLSEPLAKRPSDGWTGSIWIF